eukprot:CAMPEP_0168763116 /NCGR_PEP_ID=MMETSP0724-20121128/24194_1 /TAXON_ID=265536 /ORGANISM="Amphiprora sp., Strain CCMP467" /LENGTH=368 /DNA_ID=CAMNT_0008812303 /DNA_START=348 /DNA_END=1453 /DNA_ORIENTATION=+
MTDDDSNNTGDDGALLPWYDYEPGAEVPNHVKYLRIGVQQALTAAVKTGTAPGIIELPDRLCGQATNLRRVQIHVHAVELIPWNAVDLLIASKLEQVEFVASTGQSSAAAATSNLPVQSPRLTRIGDYAFGGCSMLRSVDGMSNVSCCLARIGDNAFRRCEKLTALDLHCLARLQFLELFSFYECKSLTVVDLSNSVLLETICEYTFSFCMDLKVVHLPPNLKQIQSNAFRDCNALASIVIPASVEFMGHHAFFDCPSLTRITFQSTRHWHRLLNDQQFSLCTSLHTLELQRPPAITAELWSIHKAFADIAESRPIPWLHLAAYLGVGGLPHQRKLWPLLLEQFLPQTHNGMFARAGIRQGPQRSTMA